MTIQARGLNDTWRPVSINENKVSNPEKGATLIKYIDELGDQGWELVSESIHSATSAGLEKVGSGYDDIKEIYALADKYATVGAGIESISSVSQQFTQTWLIILLAKVSTLRFKRQKS